MSEPEYKCVSCGKTYEEWELDVCEACGHRRCPRIIGKSNCGGEIVTIKEYERAMREDV